MDVFYAWQTFWQCSDRSKQRSYMSQMTVANKEKLANMVAAKQAERHGKERSRNCILFLVSFIHKESSGRFSKLVRRPPRKVATF